MIIESRNPVQRVLMGPGPSTVDPRILRAMSEPTLGHLDPQFLKIMNECMDMLRYIFNTENRLTIPMSGTGSSGMETTFVNILEPGDKVVIGVNGVFGMRMADMAGRCGAQVIQVEAPWGKPIDPADVDNALAKNSGVKFFAVVHAETSTGVLQPLKELADICKKYDVIFLADTVTSLGGVPVDIDDNGVDVSFSGTQKCLGCPPGLAPVTFNEKASKAVKSRKTKVQSWYLDLSMIEQYWGNERVYHHTAPINMIYALHESLRIIVEEGRESRFKRHKKNHKALGDGLEAMGLSLIVDREYRLPSLTTVYAPEGINEADVRKQLLEKYNMEIGGGLGVFKGRAWRIGLMGYASNQANVFLCLTALGNILESMDRKVDKKAALEAAAAVYSS
ncbi:MAG: alanine--glyoxylate aminotransferase family protein [Dethiobacter sp.]|jgi:alanine-glyoxylate transaminase/serine-glyoxylate transaminase/serine-pyruvate transaminase|nr:alanine--glyoxylate aminotransferase family protein [Dethiobacter sp.]